MSVHSLATSKAILENLADKATQCECLAQWDDERQCICAKTVEIPLSAEKLKQAHKIIQDLDLNKQRFDRLNGEKGCVIMCYAEDEQARLLDRQGHHGMGWLVHVKIPKKLLLAALREEKAALLQGLQDTGIVSTDATNIRAMLK